MLRVIALSLLVLASPARAVLIDNAGTISYQTSQPTNIDVPGWTTGWAASGITGWDYVGQANGASAVYLGNNWVLTAGHVGASIFTLNGVSYAVVGSGRPIIDGADTVDLTLFQISGTPNLPVLAISISAPTVGASVVMTGYGGGQGETWGKNTVSQTGVSVEITGPPDFNSIDFKTVYGGANQTQLIGGDSGGGDFIFNSSTGKWELAGINEAIDEDGNSYMVQLSTYAQQINDLVAVPEPRKWSLLLLLGALAPLLIRRLKNTLSTHHGLHRD